MDGNSPPCLVDVRESLCNDQAIGQIAAIQVPLERITKLHGIMFDLDPAILAPGNCLFPPAETPEEFYRNIRPVLDRHPLARFAEVRVSGTGLHAIVRMEPPVRLDSGAMQNYWDHIVRSIQCTLPGDTNAPGITAVTRQIGSVNSKNGTVVKQLFKGELVSPKQVEEFVSRVAKAPFRTIATILLGETQINPCPVCRRNGSYLEVLDHVGKCYSNCGMVQIEHLLDCIFRSSEKTREKKPTRGSNGVKPRSHAGTAQRRRDSGVNIKEKAGSG